MFVWHNSVNPAYIGIGCTISVYWISPILNLPIFCCTFRQQWSRCQAAQRRVFGQSLGFTSGCPCLPAPWCCRQFAQPRSSVQGWEALRLKHVQRGHHPQQLSSLRAVSYSRIPLPSLQADWCQKCFCWPLKERRPPQALFSTWQRQHDQGRVHQGSGF